MPLYLVHHSAFAYQLSNLLTKFNSAQAAAAPVIAIGIIIIIPIAVDRPKPCRYCISPPSLRTAGQPSCWRLLRASNKVNKLKATSPRQLLRLEPSARAFFREREQDDHDHEKQVLNNQSQALAQSCCCLRRRQQQQGLWSFREVNRHTTVVSNS